MHSFELFFVISFRLIFFFVKNISFGCTSFGEYREIVNKDSTSIGQSFKRKQSEKKIAHFT